MRRLILTAHLLFAVVYLPACAGGMGDADVDDPAPSTGNAPNGAGAVPSEVDPAMHAADPAMQGVVGAAEGTPDVQGQDLGGAPEAPAGELPEAPLVGTGLLLNGSCVPVCESNETDPDPQSGQSDGWGYENNASCLVEGGAPALQGVPCDLVPEPMGPPSIPVDGVSKPPGVESTGFFVSNGRLLDRLGNDFVMRGINNPLAWFQNRTTGALAWTDQIAATGANAVRLVWETDVADTALLREAIQRTIDLNMVPMVELHDVTGGRDVDDPARMARYYADTPAIHDILIDYEDYLLINICNEWDGANALYVEAYTRAIEVMRNAGLHHTLVLDANGYGQAAPTVIAQGQTLLGVDPQHNLLFSAHMYENFRDAQTIRDTLQGAADAKIPFIVGEFGFQHGTDNQGNPIQIPIDVLMEEAQRHGFGYLAWSWTGNSADVGYLDLTARSGSVDELSGWGNDIVNGPNGIRATAQPASIFLLPP
jgi:hypothetical protein